MMNTMFGGRSAAEAIEAPTVLIKNGSVRESRSLMPQVVPCCAVVRKDSTVSCLHQEATRNSMRL